MLGKSAGIVCGVCILLAGASPAPAQTENSDDPLVWVSNAINQELIGSYDIDTTIPESPGFAVVDVNPTSVLDPGMTPISFASLSTFLDDNNNLQPGFALGGAPYWWLNRSKRLDDYRDNSGRLERLAANSSLSLAFAEGGDTGPDRLGIGISVNLIGGDYRRNIRLYECVGAIQSEISSAARADLARIKDSSQNVLDGEMRPRAEAEFRAENRIPDGADLTAPQVAAVNTRAAVLAEQWKEEHTTLFNNKNKTDLDRRLASCKTELEREFAAQEFWTVAAATPIELEDSEGSAGGLNGGSVWSSYRRPLNGFPFGLAGSESAPGYLTLFGKYDFDKTKMIDGIDDSMMIEGADMQEAMSVDFDAGTFGILYGVESPEFKASLQFGWETIDYDDNVFGLEDDDFTFYALTVDRRLRDGVWVKLQFGATEERASLESGENEYFKLSLSYDFFE